MHIVVSCILATARQVGSDAQWGADACDVAPHDTDVLHRVGCDGDEGFRRRVGAGVAHSAGRAHAWAAADAD